MRRTVDRLPPAALLGAAEAAARCGALKTDLSHGPLSPLAMHSRHETNSPYGGERLCSLESERAEREA
jgi:hypothetical protein